MSILVIDRDKSIRVVIGRAGKEGVDFGVQDDYASNLHAEVVSEDGKVVVSDLGSTNGTYLDGRRIYDKVPITRACKLRIGRTEIDVIVG